MPGSIDVSPSYERVRAFQGQREERGKGLDKERISEMANGKAIANFSERVAEAACNLAPFKKALLEFKE